ncbi:hypothetical protein HYW55_00240 [Candidatus Gottesmanbacteria bacterium]|nr:hypothetical protein [Candidatus Gottesmanbacteria bacterium]
MVDDSFSQLPASQKIAIEEWVVNSVKVKMIRKLDTLVDTTGQVNSRKLFLVPLFSIRDLMKRVDEIAPELRTFFYKELSLTISEAHRLFLHHQ